MESRSWGNLTRFAGSMSLSATGQITGRTGHPVLYSAEQRPIGEMKGTPPEGSHVPMAVHGITLSISNRAAAARCRGNLPVGSLPFGAPTSTFHPVAHPLLSSPSTIAAQRKQNDHEQFSASPKQADQLTTAPLSRTRRRRGSGLSAGHRLRLEIVRSIPTPRPHPGRGVGASSCLWHRHCHRTVRRGP